MYNLYNIIPLFVKFSLFLFSPLNSGPVIEFFSKKSYCVLKKKWVY